MVPLTPTLYSPLAPHCPTTQWTCLQLVWTPERHHPPLHLQRSQSSRAAAPKGSAAHRWHRPYQSCVHGRFACAPAPHGRRHHHQCCNRTGTIRCLTRHRCPRRRHVYPWVRSTIGLRTSVKDMNKVRMEHSKLPTWMTARTRLQLAHLWERWLPRTIFIHHALRSTAT